MGKVCEAKYVFDRLWGEEPPEIKEVVKEYKVIFKGELDVPPLTKDDSIYLHTIGKEARINRVVRSTDNSFVYFTNHIIETIKDPSSIENSKIEAFKEFEEHKAKKREAEKRLEVKKKELKYKKAVDNYNNLPWHKKLFSKKP